jgi:transposase InsO family protein
MAREVIAMSVKLSAMLTALDRGEEVNVSALCRELGISRKTFYKWRARFDAEDPSSLLDQSRRPRSNPNLTPADVENAIVEWRKYLQGGGWDHGPTTIQFHMGREACWNGRVPSPATIHRVLVRRGFVVPAPQKRPKVSWRRFEAALPNECWQIDAMDWVVATGSVKIFNLIDDHSRVHVGCRAVSHATSDEAWAAFTQAASVWGMPSGVLSDNGLCFSGKLRGFEVLFEANLRDAGIRAITGRPYHPQTTGKVERLQQTLKQFLRRQPLAETLAELQQQLDAFTDYYNHHRPHQGIGRAIPAERWHASTPARPAPQPLEHPNWDLRTYTSRVNHAGVVTAGRYKIHIGAEHEHRDAIIHVDQHHHANVFINGDLIRHLTIDPTRNYQRSGRRRGGPTQPRITS